MERECNLKRIFLRSLADKTAQLNITGCFSYSRFFSSAGSFINLNSTFLKNVTSRYLFCWDFLIFIIK